MHVDTTTGEIVEVKAAPIQLGLPGTFTPVSWEAPENLGFEEWEALGGVMSKVEGAVHWWIGDWLNYGKRRWADEYDEAERETGFSYTTLKQDAWVAGAVKVCNRLHTLSWSHHREVARLEPQEQDYWLAMTEQNNWTRYELRRQIRHAKYEEAAPLPDGPFRVFYADPPWEYSQQIDKYGPAARHYPTMTLEEICAIGADIETRAEDDAVLFLWVTSPKLEEGLAVAKAWGFDYKASFVWDKVLHNYGHYNSVRHEMLLICVRGSCVPDESDLLDSVQQIERSPEHSEKPEEFRAIIDHLYHRGNRLELFGRKNVAGWTVWGNEPGVGEQPAS